MSSKRPSSFPDEVEKILQERKRARNKVACYPCNKRKVKCDTEQPCAMCVRRGHPTICMYPSERRSVTRTGRNPASVSPQESLLESEISREPPFLGSHSTTAYMQRLGTKTGSEVAQQVSPALALGRALSWNPFQRYDQRDSAFAGLIDLLPDRESIQR
ncbi:hypothetical protein M3J09_001812 [Ascochyta lentis]